MSIQRNDVLSFNPGYLLKSYRIVQPQEADTSSAIVKPLGEGGSGIVYRAEQILSNNAVVSRAIKFFMYRDDIADMTIHAASGHVSASQFLDELRNVATFHHENIVKVIDADNYTPPSQIGLPIPYLVTDFVNGPTLKNAIDADDKFVEYFSRPGHRVLDILSQICHGVAYLHRRQHFHYDIAPKNIFLEGDPADCVVVIGDLGLCRSLVSDGIALDSKAFVVGTKEYCPAEVREVMHTSITYAEFAALQPRWDVCAIAIIGLEILNKLNLVNPKTYTWQRVLREFLSDVVKGKELIKIDELQERIHWLRPAHRTFAEVPELAETFDDKRNRLLALNSPVTSGRIRRIIDHPAVLRLKRIPQLLMGTAVLAGANHTRYEHCLGVYENMRRYILALMESEGFLRYFDPSQVETALVAAVLSNLGHVPFYHVISSLRSRDHSVFPELGADRLIDRLLRDTSHGARESLDDILEDVFPAIDRDQLRLLLSDSPTPEGNPAGRFIRSALEGSLGAAIVDYVRRDSWHLGIARGDPVDLGELTQHLLFHNGTLAVRHMGLSVVEQLITHRYWLYNRAYWNQPHRALHAMIRHVFHELNAEPRVPTFGAELAEHAFWGDEQTVLNFCVKTATKIPRPDICDLASFLLSDRPGVYNQIFQINRAESDASLHVVCDKLCEMNAVQLVQLQRGLCDRLKGLLEVSSQFVDILVDMPTRRRKFGEDINVINSQGNAVALTELSPIVSGVRSGFERHIQRARVFCHPRHKARLEVVGAHVRDAVQEGLVEMLT